jgi:integrase
MITNVTSRNLPEALRGWVSTCPSGTPRYWLMAWIDTAKAHLAPSSRRKVLAAVDRFYDTAYEINGECLDRALARCDLKLIRTTLDAHFHRLRNEAAQRGQPSSSKRAAVLGFAKDVVIGIAGDRERSGWHSVSSYIEHIDGLYRQLWPSRPGPALALRALPLTVVEELFDIFDPASGRNPFRGAPNKHRNYLMFMMFLVLGLRRGEILLIQGSSLQRQFDGALGRDRYWLHVTNLPEEDAAADPRYDPPSLKTHSSCRVLPLNDTISQVADVYLEGFRHRSRHAALFTSQKGTPLSARSCNEVFEMASSKLSSQACETLRMQGKTAIQPHDLRHTAVVRRLTAYRKVGIEHSEAVEKLRAFFGWSQTSTMPRHYARAYYETEHEEVWNDRYDAYVDAVRSLGDVL